MLCKYCDGLSINCLLELAKVEFKPEGLSFPQKAYYKHHTSYQDLVQSARDGCELCDFIYNEFREISLPGLRRVIDVSTEVTMDEAATALKISDIKFCIEADVWNYTNLQDCQLLDKILIKVGKPFEAFDNYDEGYDQSVTEVELILFTPQGEEKYIEGHQIGRSGLDPDLGSSVNYSIARNWLRECLEHHENCSKKRQSVMPTRVIDVGEVDSPLLPCLILSSGATGEYAALSHCWGGPISLLLTTQNINSFQCGIDFSNLPANFRDAILITRQLGIRYLWIDSLCIIQNSEEDWERESAQMGTVYRDAVVMIGANASRGSTGGILKHVQQDSRRTASIKLFPDSKQLDFVSIALKNFEEEDFWTLYMEGPLNSRGWTLQESFLASRILHYGSRQIYWQCGEVFEGADRVDLTTQNMDSHYREMLALFRSSVVNGFSLGEVDSKRMQAFYYEIVADYSKRSLSFPSDKLPAFSALARFLHSIFGGDYLAGIWSTDFRRGLLWHTDVETCRHVQTYRAPSWSWASTIDQVLFSGTSDKLAPTGFEVDLVSYSIGLTNLSNPYGRVESAELVLKGFTKRVYRSNQYISKLYPKNQIGQVYYDEAEPGFKDDSSGTLFKIIMAVDGKESDVLVSITISEGDSEDEDIDTSLISKQHYELLVIEIFAERGGFLRADCLVVMKVDKLEDVYRRVGYVVVGGRRGQDAKDLWDLIKSQERRALRLV